MKNWLGPESVGRKIVGMAAIALVAWSGVSSAQTPDAPTTGGLSDLDAMTFGCAKAGLNAAAREAARAPSQGSYQFAYFKILNDSHHAAYEVHFKSNYAGEADLKYCVSIYCQQGWDPKTTQTTVTMIGKERPRAGATTHDACGHRPSPARRQPTR